MRHSSATDCRALVLFGATGDLAGRFLLPALAALHAAGKLPEALCVLGAGADLLQIGFQRAAQLAEMGIGALAVKQRAAELLFQLLDGARQRRLRNVRPFRGAREVQFLAQRQEVADLMHFHRAAACPPGINA